MVLAFATFSMARAELKPNDVEASLQANEGDDTDVGALLASTTVATLAPPTTVAAGVAPTTVVPTGTAPTAPTTAVPAGGTAAAATPTTAAVTTAAPVLAGGELAIGDSVMKGAASPLRAAGFTVDAVESRQFRAYLPVIEQMQAAGQLPEVVVVHLGTNGTIDEDDADEFFTALADVPVVLVLTIYADRSWVPGNNAVIRSLQGRYPNLLVGDWAALAPDCQTWAAGQGLPGNCFASDGIHLSADGADYYTVLIETWVAQQRQAAGIQTS
ncbi:MAG: hypothetical protein IT197_10805 [Acidimicrobiia bacterium]|nr:hypothetical protein [Acidimicrobiia bacterium]